MGGVLLSNLSNDTDPKLLQLASKSSRHSNIEQALVNVSLGLQALTESEQMARYRINLGFIDR